MNDLHEEYFIPVVYTWVKTVKQGSFTRWTGLNTENIRRYLPNSVTMKRVHLYQARKLFWSTRSNHQEEKLTPPVKSQ